MCAARYEFYLASSLEKVFPTQRPAALGAGTRISAWRGTRAAVQLICHADSAIPGALQQAFELEITGAPCECTIRKVDLLPSDFPCACFPGRDGSGLDDNYLTKAPGLFPDLLSPSDSKVIPLPDQYRSLWLSWEIPADAAPGDYSVTVTVRAEDRSKQFNCLTVFDPNMVGLRFDLPLTLHVGKAELPPQELIHTEWFHPDCLASYYHVPTFSEEHWRIIENFIRAAGREHGINMLLTPVFSLPLDVAVGTYRPTTQLVDIRRDGGVYSFGFEKLRRWCGLCKKHGIDYLEISHLFSQWGAAATPKIVAAVDGIETQIFGWDVSASGGEYRSFLEVFLPALCRELRDMGYDNRHVYFHISDEPNLSQLESYRAARAQVEDLLQDYPIIDAMSSIEFYNQGLISHPIPSSDTIEPFVEAQVPDLWVYYCVAQCRRVPNRFYAMPSARNRIMGVLMYLYHIKGFLHWGFNFYYSQYSRRLINPYCETHAGYAFSSGDAYLVYPGENGEALSSIRAEVQDDALLDLRALQKLEALTSADFVRTLILEEAAMERITFEDYPHEAAFLLNLREKVAEEIDRRS